MMESVFRIILNMSLTGGFVIFAVLLLCIPLNKAPKWISYALWLVVLLRLLCPFSFESAAALLPSAEIVPEALLTAQSPAIHSGLPAIDAALNPVILESLAPSPYASANPAQTLFFSLGIAWAIGVGGMLIYALITTLRFYSRIQYAIHISGNIYESDRIDTAFVFHFIRPRIYLPAGLTEEQRSYVLLHEQTHIRRMDHITRLLAFFTLAVHWFNPLVWLAYFLSDRDMELSCDESVLHCAKEDIRKPYGETLLSVSTRRWRFISPLAFGESNTKERIKNVLHYKKPAFWILLIAILVVLTASVCLLANPPVEVPPPENAAVADTSNTSDTFDTSYSLTHVSEDGEILSATALLPEEGASLAQDIIMDYMVKSAAWPGITPSNMGEHYVIRQHLSGETHDYYAFLKEGLPVLQPNAEGFYSRISDELYDRMVAYAQELAPEKEAAQPRQESVSRVLDYPSEFSIPPRGEAGFEYEYTSDWDGDGKVDRAFMTRRLQGSTAILAEQFVIVSFGNGTKIAVDSLELEGMSNWGRSFLIESADLTGDGQNEILLLIDLGGQGGHGSYGLYPYKYTKDGWVLMDAPHRGYALTLGWQNNHARLTSGDYLDVIFIDTDMIRRHYINNGAREEWERLDGAEYHAENATDPICDIALIEEGGHVLVRISQYITGMTGSHADCLGYLVTTLEWNENGEYAVRDMQVYYALWPRI